MKRAYDAIIIGCGIIGAAVALELARKGWRTLNLDRLPAAGYGSTGASCAVIRFNYSTVAGSALAHEGSFYWKQWRDHIGVADERGLSPFREIGLIVFKAADNGRLEKTRLTMDAAGIPYQDWDRAALRRRLPGFDLRCYAPPRNPEDAGFGEPSPEELPGALFFPTAGYVSDPQLAAHNEQRAVEDRGGIFRFNATVTEILKDAAGRVAGVRLAQGDTLAAPVVVNVAGPHSAKVNAMAGALADMRITTRALKREVAHVPMPIPRWYEEGCIISDSDIGCYSRPETGDKLLVGSQDPECDRRHWVDPDEWDDSFTEQWRNQVLRQAQRIPALGVPNTAAGIVACYDVSDDWIPIYDKSCVPGFYMAVGTSGNQFKNAAVAGALMAELIEACENGRDHDRDPLQFPMRHTGCTLDLGFFSRLRAANPESSNSVLG